MALLIGTDFNEGVGGIGPKKALNLIKKHGSLEHALAELKVDIESKDEVRRIFLEPRVLEEVAVEFHDPDPDGVRTMLCDEFAFSGERIDQALAKFAGARGQQKQKSLDTWFN
jgi:flap endonuclease-1